MVLRMLCPLCEGVAGWPGEMPSIYEMNRLAWTDRRICAGARFREIRAICDQDVVRVYQAYNERIAREAVAANSFRAPLDSGKWSGTRMTWIKPSAVWMAYRCGWSVMKDENQARVLALDLSRRGFEELLMQAQLTHSLTRTPGALKQMPVVVQWDPERLMDPTAAEGRHALTSDVQGMRSIQIGLRNEGSMKLLDPEFVLRITDVTAAFTRAHEHLAASPPDVDAACAALWPDRREVQMFVPPELRRRLEMDGPGA